jgi:hypothetical protein
MFTIRKKINNKFHQIEVPEGCRVVCGGSLLKGDFVYDPSVRKFDTVKMDGNVNVLQCHLVVRKFQAGAEVSA